MHSVMHCITECMRKKTGGKACVLHLSYDAFQAVTTTHVIMGDKEDPDTYAIFNEPSGGGTIVDLAETHTGDGGGDTVVEMKVYKGAPRIGQSPAPGTVFRGDTHAFGNTEEMLLVENRGRAARAGDHAWDHSTGSGSAAAVRGKYHDALHVKHNTLHLALANHLGGLAPGSLMLLKHLERRARDSHVDRTEYASPADTSFTVHWGRRIANAVVQGDADRSLRRLRTLRTQAFNAARQRAATAPGAAAGADPAAPRMGGGPTGA